MPLVRKYRVQRNTKGAWETIALLPEGEAKEVVAKLNKERPETYRAKAC